MKFHQLTERGPHPLVVSKSYLDTMFAEDQSVLLLDWKIEKNCAAWVNILLSVFACYCTKYVLTITVLLKCFLKAFFVNYEMTHTI